MVHPDMIRVIIIDDHINVRKGLRLLLETEDNVLIVGEGATGIDAISLCNQLLPDVVIMDMKMPDMDGIAATRIIHQQHPTIRILMLSLAVDQNLIEQALDAGAAGFVSKYHSLNELMEAIQGDSETINHS